MIQVALTDVAKSYGPVTALAGVSLSVTRGELLAVLGPSGCGKTTLLRAVAGLERLDAGSIEIAGTVVAGPGTHRPTHKRGAVIVPQDASLFPHLTVAGNVGFGLTRGSHSRIDEVLELVGLAGLGGRMPHELSGGQQQRVSVARALAPRSPLILLDEPFSALDAALRADLRSEVRQALRADNATAILVTHDQGEALSIADRVAVLHNGTLRQIDTPARLYLEPREAWVAEFVGEANLFPVHQRGPEGYATPLGPVTANGTGDLLLLRPERIRLDTLHEGALPDAAVPGIVQHVAYHGHDVLVTVDLGGRTVQVRGSDVPPEVGATVGLSPAGAGQLLHS